MFDKRVLDEWLMYIWYVIFMLRLLIWIATLIHRIAIDQALKKMYYQFRADVRQVKDKKIRPNLSSTPKTWRPMNQARSGRFLKV